MKRRPRRSNVDELSIHIQQTQATRSQADVLRQLYPDVPEFMTAVAVLELAEKRLAEKKQQAMLDEAPPPQSAASDAVSHGGA